MAAFIYKHWQVISWRILICMGLVMLNSWASAAFHRPSLAGTLSEKSTDAIAVSISFSQPASAVKEDIKPEESAEKSLEPAPKPRMSEKLENKTHSKKKAHQPLKQATKSKTKQPKQVKAQPSAEPPQKPVPTQHKEQRAQASESSKAVQETKTDSKTPTQQPSADNIASTMTKEVFVTKPVFAAPPKPPRYPKLARKRGQEGTVWLEIWLDENGKQSKLAITKSSGKSSLDQSAVKAVSAWQFKPYEVGGIRIASRVRIPVEFSLN